MVDKIQEGRKYWKDSVAEVVDKWAKSIVSTYEEPVRTGTPKGEPIGLSKKKRYAALLSVGYPRLFSLKDIAEKSGNSVALVRKWRTEGAFLGAIEDAYDLFTEMYINTLQRVMADIYAVQSPPERDWSVTVGGKTDFKWEHKLYAAMLPYLDLPVRAKIEIWLREKVEGESTLGPYLVFATHMHLMRKDEKENTKSKLELVALIQKVVLVRGIDILLADALSGTRSPSDLIKFADGLKAFIKEIES
jgi:hypothetical protein